MKKGNYRIILLGIAIMLLGLCCIAKWGTGAYLIGGIVELIALIAPYLGFDIVILGFLIKDENSH